MKLTSTKSKSSYVNFLIYGEAGIGKTTLASTVSRPLIISAEGGLLALSDFDIPVYDIKSRDDCNEVYEYLVSSKDAENYDVICIDSLSEIAEVLLSSEKKLTKDPRQAYGVMADEMATLIRGFRDLRKDVYFTAKMKRVEDEESHRVNYMPSVPGQTLLQSLPHAFDELFVARYGKLEDGSSYRYIQTQGTLQYIAKDRSGTLDPVLPMDLGSIIETIKKGERIDK